MLQLLFFVEHIDEGNWVNSPTVASPLNPEYLLLYLFLVQSLAGEYCPSYSDEINSIKVIDSSDIWYLLNRDRQVCNWQLADRSQYFPIAVYLLALPTNNAVSIHTFTFVSFQEKKSPASKTLPRKYPVVRFWVALKLDGVGRWPLPTCNSSCPPDIAEASRVLLMSLKVAGAILFK